jgi:radical SAM-linked protein
MPKISFTNALPVGTESLHETAYADLHETMSPSRLKEKINGELPAGMKISEVMDIHPGKKKAGIKESRYRITLNGLRIDQQDVESFLLRDTFPIEKIGKKGPKKIDARAQVKSMNLASPSLLTMTLRRPAGPELKPVDIIKAVFRLDDNELKGIKILKTGQVLG